jgi:vitamin B12 transporter
MQLGAGSFNRFDERLAFSGAAGGLDFAVGLYNSRQGGDSSVGGGGDLPHSGYDGKYGADIDAGYTFLDNHRIGFHFVYSAVDNMEAAGVGYPDLMLFPDNFRVYNQYRYHTTFTYAGKTNNELFSWLVEYAFGKNKSENLGYFNDNFGWTRYPEPDDGSDSHNKVQEFKVQSTFDNKLFAITLGFDYLKYEYFNHYYSIGYPSTPTTANVDDIAGYILAKIRLIDNSLILSFGARYDEYKTVYTESDRIPKDTNFMPSIGISYLINDYIKLRANYSKGFRIPQASEIFGDTSRIPNLDLKPETTSNIEFGTDFSYKYLDVSLTYFITDYKNKIIALAAPATPGRVQFRNLANTATYSGIEANLAFDIGKFFNMDFSLTPFVDLTLITARRNRDTNPNNIIPEHQDILPYVPDLMASYGIKFNHPKYNFSAKLNAVYIGKSYSQDWNWLMDYPWSFPSEYPFLYFGGFTVVDFSLNKRLWDLGERGHIYLVADLNNIFDENYAYSMDYPMPGRNFYFGVGYEF